MQNWNTSILREASRIAQASNTTQRSRSYCETGARMILPWVQSAIVDFHHTSVDDLLGRANVRIPHPSPRPLNGQGLFSPAASFLKLRVL